MRNKTDVAPEKRHIVVQCNNLFKAIFSHLEVEGNQCKIFFVRMFRLLTKLLFLLLITARH